MTLKNRIERLEDRRRMRTKPLFYVRDMLVERLTRLYGGIDDPNDLQANASPAFRLVARLHPESNEPLTVGQFVDELRKRSS